MRSFGNFLACRKPVQLYCGAPAAVDKGSLARVLDPEIETTRAQVSILRSSKRCLLQYFARFLCNYVNESTWIISLLIEGQRWFEGGFPTTMPHGVRLVTARPTLTQRNGLTWQRWRSQSRAPLAHLQRLHVDGRVRLSNEWAPSGGIAASENEGMPLHL